MSRRRRAERRKLSPDPVYKSVLATRFINGIMLDGKKTTASKLFYQAIERLSETAPEHNGFAVFEQAITKRRAQQPLQGIRSGLRRMFFAEHYCMLATWNMGAIMQTGAFRARGHVPYVQTDGVAYVDFRFGLV